MTKLGEMTPEEKKAIFCAWADGKSVEFFSDGGWQRLGDYPGWQRGTVYRIAPTPDTIDWAHVTPEFKYMARDENGVTWLYTGKMPVRGGNCWHWGVYSKAAKASTLSSYKRGTCDWKDSLVIRDPAGQ